MATEDLGIKLGAEVNDFVSGLAKAAKAADTLQAKILEIEKSIASSLAKMEAIARGSLGKTTAAFVGSARRIDAATDEIVDDSRKAGAALSALGTQATKAGEQVGRAADAMGRSAAGMRSQFSAGVAGAATPLGELGDRFDAVGERIRGSVFSIQNALIGLGALRFGQAAVDTASKFEAALGQLEIVAADSGRSIQEFRADLLELSKATPVGLLDLTKSLGTAVGTLPKGANQAATAFEALTAAQAAARASGATAEEVLTGLTAILNTYGKTGITSQEITDKLFATFDQGGATVPQLTASIGQVAGIAAQFGISIDEVFGSIAVLTRGGQTAAEAITNLRQAFISTARPPEKVREELEKLGLSADLFSSDSLKRNGLIGVLEQLQAAGGESAIEKLYTDVQGFLGVSTLLGAGLTQVRDDIDRIGQSAGKTDAAVKTIAGNFDQLAGIAKNRLSAVMIDIGERIMPTVARVLGQLADYAETNGAQIADGIGKAVDALAALGAWVVEYGDEVVTFFLAFKGASFFTGLAKDIAAAATALGTFVQGYRASAAIGEGLAGLGAQAGEKFSGGFAGKLKSLGPAMSAALRSPGIIGAVIGVGVVLGQELGEAIGDALGEYIEGPVQRRLQDSISELESRTRGRLAEFGARSLEELEAARQRIRSGEAVDVGGAGNIRDVRTLQEVSAGGGDVAAAFNAGLANLNRQIGAAQAAVARETAAMASAAAKVEELQRRQASAGELAEAQAAFAAQQRAVQSQAAQVSQLQAGSVALVGQYATLTKSTTAQTKAVATAGAKAAKNAQAAVSAAAAQSEADLQRLAQEVIDLYAREAAKLKELRLSQARSTAEAAQNEVEAKRAAFEAETQARIDALDVIEGAEVQAADERALRERQLAGIIEEQIAAIRRVTQVRIDEARAAADAEIKASATSAEIREQIETNLATQINEINADQIRREEEARRASAERIAAADREAYAARLEARRSAGQRAREGFVPGGELGVVAEIGRAAEDPAGIVAQGAAALGAAGREVGGVLGSLAESGGLIVGTLAGLANLIVKLPDLLNGLAELLTSGLDDFAAALFDSVINVLLAAATELGPQIIKILTETLPAFVEALIAALPSIIGGLIALLPQLVFALTKSLVYSLPLALYNGFVRAGEQLIEFFTTGVVASIAEGVGEAFATAGQVFIDGLVAAWDFVIAKLADFFETIGSSIGGFFTDLVGVTNGGGVGSFLGRTVGLTAFGKLVSGNLGDLSVEDVPLIGGFVGLFHEGGAVGAGMSNPSAAMALAQAGAPRFTNGGMVGGLDNIARRRMSQILRGDDVPALLARGEGVLTARGVDAVGGPKALDAINRGNEPIGGTQAAQVVLSARIGGDRALAALVSRIVSVSLQTPAGAVRSAIDRSNRATSIPGVSFVGG